MTDNKVAKCSCGELATKFCEAKAPNGEVCNTPICDACTHKIEYFGNISLLKAHEPKDSKRFIPAELRDNCKHCSIHRGKACEKIGGKECQEAAHIMEKWNITISAKRLASKINRIRL